MYYMIWRDKQKAEPVLELEACHHQHNSLLSGEAAAERGGWGIRRYLDRFVSQFIICTHIFKKYMNFDKACSSWPFEATRGTSELRHASVAK